MLYKYCKWLSPHNNPYPMYLVTVLGLCNEFSKSKTLINDRMVSFFRSISIELWFCIRIQTNYDLNSVISLMFDFETTNCVKELYVPTCQQDWVTRCLVYFYLNRKVHSSKNNWRSSTTYFLQQTKLMFYQNVYVSKRSYNGSATGEHRSWISVSLTSGHRSRSFP